METNSCPSLEFGNLQASIYADLSRNVGECKSANAVESLVDLVKSNVEVSSNRSTELDGEASDASQRTHMVREQPFPPWLLLTHFNL